MLFRSFMPWCRLSGLKCPPAVVKAGPSHFAVVWICRACSPAGKPFRSSATFTPLPPVPSESVAVPTSFPDASFSATVTGLFCAKTTEQNTMPAARIINFVFKGTSFTFTYCKSILRMIVGANGPVRHWADNLLNDVDSWHRLERFCVLRGAVPKIPSETGTVKLQRNRFTR